MLYLLHISSYIESARRLYKASTSRIPRVNYMPLFIFIETTKLSILFTRAPPEKYTHPHVSVSRDWLLSLKDPMFVGSTSAMLMI